jgi:hypothetical protein
MKNQTIPDWHAITSWAMEERNRLREQLESIDLPDDQTAAIRGELRLLKRLLALPDRAAQELPRDVLGY